jgi:hypothetical protein
VAWLGGEAPLLRPTSYAGEGTGEKFLAGYDDHGEQIEWPTPAEDQRPAAAFAWMADRPPPLYSSVRA